MFWRLGTILLLLGVCAPQAGAQTSANPYVFPLIVHGGKIGSSASFRSTLRLTSTNGTDPLICTMLQRNTSPNLQGLDGYTYITSLVSSDISPLSITPLNQDLGRPSDILVTKDVDPNKPSPVKTGYAKLSCQTAFQAQLQYSYYDAAGNKIGEATVLPATKGNSFQFQFDSRDKTRLGFSLVNDSTAQRQFRIVARDQFNQIVRFAYDTIQPTSQFSRFVDEELSLPADFTGTVEIVGDASNQGSQSYAVGLQFTGSIFTTVQPVVRDTPLPGF
jgi:hypothetical protein